MPNTDKSFIETQFPVSKISKESYKERKAGSNQTLTGLGKWWGRKPLVLVRSAILGMLIPSSDDKHKDMEIFLKIMTMDDEGLLRRKNKNFTGKKLFSYVSESDKEKIFQKKDHQFVPKFKSGVREEKEKIRNKIFKKLSYDEKLRLCLRPEEVEPDDITWKEINKHLKTNAKNIEELVQELGKKKFGKIPRIGDAFAGGGSIPFEAGRIGADVFASDLNPLACLLSWAGLNILSKTDAEISKLKDFQEKVFDAVCEQVEEWDLENSEDGMKAKYYLYCNETICPECKTKVPLSPNWIVSKKYKIIALLEYNENKKNFDIIIKTDASKEDMKNSSKTATIQKGKLVCPKCKKTTPISSIRGDRKDNDNNAIYGLRRWKKNEFLPQENDVFQERLYCILYLDKKRNKYYREPTENDLQRESKTIELLEERFEEWQRKGFLPELRIEEGYNTSQIMRERGWQYWHQLFNPRQLLIHGLFMEKINEMAESEDEKVLGLLGGNTLANYNSKPSYWQLNTDKGSPLFNNQALNTTYDTATRGLSSLYSAWMFNLRNYPSSIKSLVEPKDARHLNDKCDIWITDPPYADAVNYHELSEFFLAWDAKQLQNIFPDWYADTKRALAVKGTGKSFNESMVEIYSNLRKNMPDNGMQMVMFTHQDVSVWADLTYILWASGLRVTAAWNVATETESGGLKSGNYVKGTVLLVLRKQTSNDLAFKDELYDDIKYEVIGMIDSMRNLDDKEDPNFSDADYLLASYASTLKVITAYKEIDGIDLNYWLTKERNKSDEENPVENLINKAVRIAYDYLLPDEFEKSVWQDLKEEERFYIRALELEMNGATKISSYQELARGFGVSDYKDMFSEFKANSAKLRTPIEYKMKYISDSGFGSTILRKVLVAIYESSKSDSTIEGITYLKNAFEDNQFYYQKKVMIELLNFISKTEFVSHLINWHKSAHIAKLLREALKNEGV